MQTSETPEYVFSLSCNFIDIIGGDINYVVGDI